jgi:hypothetical protein
MTLKKVVIAWLIVWLPISIASSAPTRPPIRVTFCELVAHAQRYDHKMVKLYARIESDGFEHISQLSEDCPRVAVRFSEPIVPNDAKSLDTLNQAIDHVYFHGPNKGHLTVTALIVGVFYFRTDMIQHELRPVSAEDISIHYGKALFPPHLQLQR